jgi:hypothetical protein
MFNASHRRRRALRGVHWPTVRCWSDRRIKGMAGLGRMTARLGALVARIDRAFHGLESQDVMRDRDTMEKITELIDSKETARNLARVSKMHREVVRNDWASYPRVCRFMNTLVDETVANASDRKIDACCLGDGKYLMRLTDKTAMGYVVAEKAGATVTTLRWLRGGGQFSMHELADVCVSIRAGISNIDDLRSDLAAWGLKEPRSADVNSEVGAASQHSMDTRSGTVFDDAPVRPSGLYIWRNPNNYWQFKYGGFDRRAVGTPQSEPDTSTLVRGTIIRTGATALVWGFAERKGGHTAFEKIGVHNFFTTMCYSMRDNIRSSQELYAFITTHEWTNPEKVVFEHPTNELSIEGRMHSARRRSWSTRSRADAP